MRIAHIVCSFPPYQGGIGNSCFCQAKELTKRGNQVTVFTPLYNEENKNFSYPFDVVRLKPFIKYGNAAFLPQLFFSLKNFDIIHLHYPFFGAAELIGFFKKPVVLQYHMDVVGSGLLGNFFKFHTKFIAPKIIKKADLIICSSFDYIKNSNIAKFYQNNPDKFKEAPFGVDTNIFYPEDKDQSFLSRHNLKKEDKIILFVGGLDKAHYFKGLDKLLRAAAKLKVKLLIIGAGDLREYYQKLVEKLGIKDDVIFVGSVLNQELPKYYNLADIFVLPSIDKSEAFGIVLLEAMACAKPVIASDLPGVRTVVDNNETGLLARPGNENDLSDKLKYLLENKNSREKFGLAGRKKIEEKYNWVKLSEKLEKIYLDLLK